VTSIPIGTEKYFWSQEGATVHPLEPISPPPLGCTTLYHMTAVSKAEDVVRILKA